MAELKFKVGDKVCLRDKPNWYFEYVNHCKKATLTVIKVTPLADQDRAQITYKIEPPWVHGQAIYREFTHMEEDLVLAQQAWLRKILTKARKAEVWASR